MQEVVVKGGPGPGISGKGSAAPTIRNVNDFFACVFPNLLVLPLIVGTTFISPISHFLGGKIKEVAQKTQKDGTDSFFLINEFPTSRKQIFGGKIFFLVSSLVAVYILFVALPLSLLLGKTNYLVNFTGIQTFLFLAWNFLITPIFFFAPLVLFFSSVASLNQVLFFILRVVSGSLLIIFPRKELQIIEFFKGLKSNQFHSLLVLIIVGLIIPLSLFTVWLAHKKFQRKDLI